MASANGSAMESSSDMVANTKAVAHTRNNSSHSTNSFDIKGALLSSFGSKSSNFIVNESPETPLRPNSKTERSNLALLIKLVVKELLEKAMKKKRTIEFNDKSMNHFFILIEHALKHGLRVKKSLLGPSKRELWTVLESIVHHKPDAIEITASAKDLPNTKTNTGRARAWLRLAFMQKSLPDYFKMIVDKKESFFEYYEPDSFIMNEEAIVVAGLLLGLNIIDCNDWCVKDEDLDFQDNLLDLSSYLRDGLRQHSYGQEDEDDGNVELQEVLDQKNYLEEMNRHLRSTIVDLKRRAGIVDEPAFDRRRPSFDLPNSHHSSLDPTDHSEMPESKTKSKELSEKEIRELKACRSELETQTQTNLTLKQMNNELETAMKLLETDIHEKQDTIISLRRQLDDIKTINLQLYSRLKDLDSFVKSKNEQIERLEAKSAVDAKSIGQLEDKISNIEKKRRAYEDLNKKQIAELMEKEQKRQSTEGDLKIEREWRTSLKQLVDDQQQQVATLQADNDSLRERCERLENLEEEYKIMKKKCSDFELSLEEIGVKLRDSNLAVDDLKETSTSLKNAVWARDSDIKECYLCEKPFSVSKRKHHCRNCGNIFCASCSDNKLPLPSSAKPVRVCDNCYTVLLERYTGT